MKKIILFGFFISCIATFGNDPAPSTSDTSTVSDGSTGDSKPNQSEKDRFEEIRDLEKATAKGGNTQAVWDTIETKIDAYQADFGHTSTGEKSVALLRHYQLIDEKRFADGAIYKALLEKLQDDALPEVAAMAKQQIALEKQMADLKSQPMDLKFTAVDGGAVDLAEMRGKVVLVDFWATWCPPCREEVPDVVATYKKYHDQGFEVIGISLDEDKAALLAFTKQNGMVWPQYFDGQGWDNKISNGFGIASIPTMWLVDQKGMVVTREGGDDLSGQVEKLLQAGKAAPAPSSAN